MNGRSNHNAPVISFSGISDFKELQLLRGQAEQLGACIDDATGLHRDVTHVVCSFSVYVFIGIALYSSSCSRLLRTISITLAIDRRSFRETVKPLRQCSLLHLANGWCVWSGLQRAKGGVNGLLRSCK